MSCRISKLLKRAIVRTGTPYCGCLRVHEVVAELERLQVSDKQVDDIVTLTLTTSLLERKGNVDIDGLCLNTVRFMRGIRLWKATRDSKLE